jgi:hypothetical protein
VLPSVTLGRKYVLPIGTNENLLLFQEARRLLPHVRIVREYDQVKRREDKEKLEVLTQEQQKMKEIQEKDGMLRTDCNCL